MSGGGLPVSIHIDSVNQSVLTRSREVSDCVDASRGMGTGIMVTEGARGNLKVFGYAGV